VHQIVLCDKPSFFSNLRFYSWWSLRVLPSLINANMIYAFVTFAVNLTCSLFWFSCRCSWCHLIIRRFNNFAPTFLSGKDQKKKVASDKAMEFDPIRQHRYFCPWITSTGNGATGWQQTLSALLRQKGFSPSPWNSPSASIIKVILNLTCAL
jgi:hypothetical protein